MIRSRLSNIFASTGALATVGLLTSGILIHYGVLPLEGTLSLLLISISAIVAPVGLALSIIFASQVKGETLLRAGAEVVHVISLAGFVINLLMTGSDKTGASWWRAIAFGIVVFLSAAAVMSLEARMKRGSSRI